MPRTPIILMHGYSDKGASFANWHTHLQQNGYRVEEILTSSYVTLTNEVTLEDIAEGFDLALQQQAGLRGEEPFDAIVHSTGMLVLRAWLSVYGKRRRNRLKRLIGLAPATFGSPLAHKGRSWIGAVVKGNKEITDPDFLEAGDVILDALELGSKFTWDLTHVDLLGNDPVFGPDGDTPYVFTFGGNRQYGGLVGLISSLGRFDDSGTDGTVRWSGMALDSRKILLDLTSEAATQRLGFVEHNAALTPFIPIDGHDHGSILKEPKPLLIDLVNKALQVTDKASFEAWKSEASQATNDVRERMLKSEAWQQFVIHVSDERGRSIPDWVLELFISNTDGAKEERALPVDVHPYRADPSYRCFHVNLSDFWDKKFEDLWIRLSASVGSSLVGYQGFTNESLVDPVSGFWQGRLNLAHLVAENRPTFFYPFTTTLVEIRINRQPALDKLFIF